MSDYEKGWLACREAAAKAIEQRVRAEERAKCEAENAEFEAAMEADLRELTPEEEAKCKSEVDRVMAKFNKKMAENAAHDARVRAAALREAINATCPLCREGVPFATGYAPGVLPDAHFRQTTTDPEDGRPRGLRNECDAVGLRLLASPPAKEKP